MSELSPMSSTQPHRLRRVPFLGTAAAFLLALAMAGFARPAQDSLSPRFNHVMLYVSDLEASIGFYTEAFDLEVTQRIDEIAVRTADGTESTVPVRMAFLKFPGQEFVFELSEQPVNGDAVALHYQHLGVDVTDIEAAAVRVQAAGGADYTGIRTVRATGGIEAMNAFFTGPDGELVELMQMVSGEF